MHDAGIVIIGSGLAGYSVAKEIRRYNAELKITIITHDSGRFYPKPQLSVALAQGKDIAALTVNTAAEMAEQLDVDVVTDTIINQIDREKKRVYADQTRYWNYTKLVLAQGAEPIRLALTGDAADDVISINSLQDYENFRARVQGKSRIAIIGAGLVGCEFAHDFMKAGHQVSVIDLAPYPLQKLLPQQCARAVEHALADEGVRWYLGDSVTAVEQASQGLRVLTAQHGAIEADYVLSAVGLRPRIALAKASALLTQHGICVDEYLQSSDASIFALGDCAEVLGKVRLYIAPLLHCARSLAKTLCGEPSAVKFPPMPVVIKTASCPVALVLPPEDVDGRWEVSGQAPDLSAKYYSAAGKFLGFVLTGGEVKQRVSLMKQLQI